MNADQFRQAVADAEQSLAAINSVLGQALAGRCEFHPDTLHPLDGLRAAAVANIQSAHSCLHAATLILNSWDEIKDMCDEVAAEAAMNETEGARPTLA